MHIAAYNQMPNSPQNQLRHKNLLNVFKFQSIFNDCFIYDIGLWKRVLRCHNTSVFSL